MFNRIVVAVDGSEHALKALELAVTLQNKFDSELLLLCVYRHHSQREATLSMVRPQDPDNVEDSMREFATGVVEHAKKRATELGAAKPRAFIKGGPPSRTIVKFAKEKKASLIVLGSRGHGEMEAFLLGSVSHKVTSLADCPVLVA
ncbi:universal stress protein [Limibacillus sp. MBR-115]|jgi:nucleotide-binding universal stress UspA family protein|uniref:universal stress protein n=1 Tax=Limibacillus sp. MBR-115 TaxID=3156465 RepID=UPI00339738A2